MQFEASNPLQNSDRNFEAKSLEYSQNVFRDVDFTKLPALQDRTDSADQFLPPLELKEQGDLSGNQYTQPKDAALAKDAANARDQMPGLRERLGQLDPEAKNRDGLTLEDINRLEQCKDLTKEQRDAIRFLKENYETLSTTRGLDVPGKFGWVSWQRGDRRITTFSLERNAQDAKPTGSAEYSVGSKSWGGNEREIGDDHRLIPSERQTGEKKNWNPSRR